VPRVGLTIDNPYTIITLLQSRGSTILLDEERRRIEEERRIKEKKRKHAEGLKG